MSVGGGHPDTSATPPRADRAKCSRRSRPASGADIRRRRPRVLCVVSRVARRGDRPPARRPPEAHGRTPRATGRSVSWPTNRATRVVRCRRRPSLPPPETGTRCACRTSKRRVADGARARPGSWRTGAGCVTRDCTRVSGGAGRIRTATARILSPSGPESAGHVCRSRSCSREK
jgi:hypothetical protein